MIDKLFSSQNNFEEKQRNLAMEELTELAENFDFENKEEILIRDFNIRVFETNGETEESSSFGHELRTRDAVC